jgi:hypothetical protein
MMLRPNTNRPGNAKTIYPRVYGRNRDYRV